MTVTWYLGFSNYQRAISMVVLGGFGHPEGVINRDTTLTIGHELVKDPCVLEATLSERGGSL